MLGRTGIARPYSISVSGHGWDTDPAAWMRTQRTDREQLDGLMCALVLDATVLIDGVTDDLRQDQLLRPVGIKHRCRTRPPRPWKQSSGGTPNLCDL